MEVDDGCGVFEFEDDDFVTSVDIYHNQYINGMKLFLENGQQIILGERKSSDTTTEWSFETEGQFWLGVEGIVKDERLLSLTPIVYDQQCALDAKADWDAEQLRIQQELEEAQAALEAE